VGFAFVSTSLSGAGLYLNYALGGGLISELRAPPDPPAPRRLPGQRWARPRQRSRRACDFPPAVV